MNKLFSILCVAALLATVTFGSGCAHVHDASKSLHMREARAIAVPPGWTVVGPNITNTATESQTADYSVIAPSGTNAPGFFASIVAPRPKVFRAYRETWVDESTGGGTFVDTDPQASSLLFARTNQTALGGSHTASVGAIQSTITTNAVAAIGAMGTAVGNVIGAAATAAGK